MIKVENIEVYNIARAIYSARNPMNSWAKSDSDLKNDILGPNDLDLAKRLYNAGPEHRKYLRQIFVSMDITAPLYWISEFDTYKIGVTRNSCSFMHKGVSKPFDISDFSVHDDRIREILSDLPSEKTTFKYPYETNEYRVYTTKNGRNHRVYRNGSVISEPFEYTDELGRNRHFDECVHTPSQTSHGYFEIKLGGADGEKWLVHRLIATVWLDNPDNFYTVNHIDGDKGNNCVENLEWCSLQENISKGFENGLFDNGKSLHSRYLKWKYAMCVVDPITYFEIHHDHDSGMTAKALAEKYELTEKQINNTLFVKRTPYNYLFSMAYEWERVIEKLNELRDLYLESKDPEIFQQIRCLLPCGYNQRFTATMNYENVISMIHQRTGHKLTEWNEFVDILKDLPYIKAITEG